MLSQVAFPDTTAGWVAFTLAVLAAVVAIFDAWLGVVHGEASTVSAVVKEASHRWPAVPLGVGLLIGHLFL